MNSASQMISRLPISPLSLDQTTRDTWWTFDGPAIAQLAPLAGEGCYQPKFYKAPASEDEVFAPYGYVPFGLKITPGSIIYGVYSALSAAPTFNLQITDQSLKDTFWDEPIPSWFVQNTKMTAMSISLPQLGAFPSLLNSPYPVTGSGLFLVEIWETSGATQRIELVLGVLEVVKQ